MNDKWVGGLGLDEVWEKGQKCKFKLHRCPWSGHPSQTFGESNGGLQWCALAQNSKCELIQLPARPVCLELRPQKSKLTQTSWRHKNILPKTHKPAIVWARHVFPEPVLPINMRTFSPSVALLRSGSCSFCIYIYIYAAVGLSCSQKKKRKPWKTNKSKTHSILWTHNVSCQTVEVLRIKQNIYTSLLKWPTSSSDFNWDLWNLRWFGFGWIYITGTYHDFLTSD